MASNSKQDHDPPVDNVEQAMDRVATEMTDMSVRSKEPNTSDHELADKQVLVRVTPTEHERWHLCASKLNQSVSYLVRETMNKLASDTLDCSHPPQYRKTYPWSEFCKKCNLRLR